jgi:tRNA dimethylallyltransferase
MADTGSRPPLLALYGPTSSGKTGLSIEVASRLRRELGPELAVISADSRQVYRHMDIGTSKTRPDQMRGIPHEMIDVADPVRKFELESYVAMARDRMGEHLGAGRVPFVVGGTGTYVAALVEGWNVAGTEAARAELLRDFPPDLANEAHALLQRIDRGAAKRVDPRNHEAVINALTRATTATSGERREPAREVLVLGLDPGARKVDTSVARTLDRQLEAGLFDEVVSLAARYRLDGDPRANRRRGDNQVLHTHGYREFFELAAKRRKPVAALTRQERGMVRDEILRHVRAYSRRQRTWFSKLPNVRMVSSPKEAFELLRAAADRAGRS